MFYRTLRDYGDNDNGQPLKIYIPKSLRKMLKAKEGWKIKNGYLIRERNAI